MQDMQNVQRSLLFDSPPFSSHGSKCRTVKLRERTERSLEIVLQGLFDATFHVAQQTVRTTFSWFLRNEKVKITSSIIYIRCMEHKCLNTCWILINKSITFRCFYFPSCVTYVLKYVLKCLRSIRRQRGKSLKYTVSSHFGFHFL